MGDNVEKSKGSAKIKFENGPADNGPTLKMNLFEKHHSTYIVCFLVGICPKNISDCD